MAKTNQTWTVFEHDAIETLETNLWRVEAEIPGMALRRVMTLAKQEDGSIVVHNPICLDDSAMAEIDTWGPIRFIVVPNGYHRMDCKPYKERYPEAKIVCPTAATKKVSAVVDVDLSYEQFPGDNDVSLAHMDGTSDREGVMIVRHSDGATLVFNDLVFNMPHMSGFTGFIFKRLTGSTGGPKVTRIGRMLVIKDKKRVAKHLAILADTPDLSRIIVSHHETINTDVRSTLQAIANTV